MFDLGKNKKNRTPSTRLKTRENLTLSDYITAVKWSPEGLLAASSACGELILWHQKERVFVLQSETGKSIDCLSFSRDGQYLAAGGQDGVVKIWHLPTQTLTPLDPTSAWVDQLAWSSTTNQLAFSRGRTVQIWDAETRREVTQLNFHDSSVLCLAWHPVVDTLAVGGYQGVKIWQGSNWEDDPHVLQIPSASQAVAWSPDGKYIACGNLDRTLAVVEWGNPHPWVMRGFPGKVRSLAWSDSPTVLGAPLLAVASAEGVVIWEKQVQEEAGWEGWVLEGHRENVTGIEFQPGTFLLASGSEEGAVCLWHSAEKMIQTLEDGVDGFSCLSWHPQGEFLAAGGRRGELRIWSKSTSGRGFARK